MIPDQTIQTELNKLIFELYRRAQPPRAAQNGANQTIGRVLLLDEPDQIDFVTKQTHLFKKNFSLISSLGISRFNSDGAEWTIRKELTQSNYVEAAKSPKRTDIYECYFNELSACDPNIAEIHNALFRASLKIFFGAFDMNSIGVDTVDILDGVRLNAQKLQYFSWIRPSAEQHLNATNESRFLLERFAREMLNVSGGEKLLAEFSKQAGLIKEFSPVEEFLINLFAGVETTVATISWFIDRLSANSDVQLRIHGEIDKMAEMPFTNCLVNETMRYFPPIPFVVREVANNLDLNGHPCSEGQLIMLSIVGAHHHPDFWEKPEEFQSSRKSFMEETFSRRAFIPFLTGPRMCGGAKLARIEIAEAARAFATLFEAERKDDVIGFDYGLALRPAKLNNIELKRRN